PLRQAEGRVEATTKRPASAGLFRRRRVTLFAGVASSARRRDNGGSASAARARKPVIGGACQPVAHEDGGHVVRVVGDQVRRGGGEGDEAPVGADRLAIAAVEVALVSLCRPLRHAATPAGGRRSGIPERRTR